MTQDNRSKNSLDPFRPPAVPLVVCDPYFSVWSMSDQLTEEWAKHWTGEQHPMCGLVRIDGKPYRFLGPEPRRRRASVPPMTQVSVEVLPTRTIYQFEAAGVHLTLTFMTPLLPHDLNVLSRPVTYLTFDIIAVDGGQHSVSLYFDVSSRLAVNVPEQKVVWSRHKVDDLAVLSCGSKDQPVLQKSGDDLRIDWGYLYLVIPPEQSSTDCIVLDSVSRGSFVENGMLPGNDDLEMPRPASDRSPTPVLACLLDFGSVGADSVSRHLALAYDDQFSIEYFHRKLRPYWRRDGMEAEGLLRAAVADYESLVLQCQRFDEELTADLRAVGGERYCRLAALAFRQCIGAHKLTADIDGSPLFFSKENFSNGCIATVDVTYPSSPFFLLFNTELLKAQLTPILDYASSSRWRFPFAPHDLGRYPLANGQFYGGGEQSDVDQMPVEECGNMLLMIAAVTKAEGKSDYALEHWSLLSRWANYLREKGLNPENQLCTDDFAGHLAQNVNLSLKAILALAAYAWLSEVSGKKDEASRYQQVAQEMAARWLEMADDRDHYRLTFDKAGTWSQKYNLVWDRLLDLNLFPPEVARKEVDYYKGKRERYGIPLDNRSRYTKLDWTVWSAMLTGEPQDFADLIEPLYRWAHESPSRVPLADWYWTHDGKQVRFQARSVVGGIYIPMLLDETTWKKWLGRG